MRLYVLNPSLQKTVFAYRVPEQTVARYVNIGPGQQEMVLDDTREAVFAVIAQHAKYGMIEDTDARAKRKGYTGLVYATDRPVDIRSAKIIERLNNDALIERGAELRKVSAVAAAETVSAKVRDAGFSEAHLEETTHSLRGEDADGNATAVNEENKVTSKAQGKHPKPW